MFALTKTYGIYTCVQGKDKVFSFLLNTVKSNSEVVTITRKVWEDNNLDRFGKETVTEMQPEIEKLFNEHK